MRRAYTLALLINFGFLGIAYLDRAFRQRPIELPVVEPVRGSAARIADAFPGYRSQMGLTLHAPLADLAALAEAAVPKRFQGNQNPPDTGGLSGIRVGYDLTRDPLALTARQDGETAKVRLTTRLKGRVHVSAFKWIIVKIPPFGPTIKTKSPTLSATFAVDAAVDGWIAPGLDGAWNFTHEHALAVTVNQADTKLFRLINLSLKKEFQSAVNSFAPALVAGVLADARDKLKVREHVGAAWAAAFQPQKLTANPDGYALFTPENVYLQSLRFDRPDALTVRVAVDGAVQTAVLARPPEARAATPLTPLVVNKDVNPRFRVLLPVGVELAAANPALAAAVRGRRIDLGGGDTLLIRDAALFAKGEAVYARLDVRADRRAGRPVVGTLFLTCGLAADERGVVRLTGVDFAVETDDLLTRAAAWLRKDAVCREVQDRVRLDLGPALAAARADANRRYGQLTAGPSVKLSARLDDLRFVGVRVRDDFLIAGFELAGEVGGELVLKR
jgi:hypothetical protein